MALFVLFALLLVAVVLAFLLPPLLGRGQGKAAIDRDSLNVTLYKDRSAELEAELAAGTLSPDQYDQARNELRRDLLVNTGAEAAGGATFGANAGPRWVTWAVAVAVPLLAVALYATLGSPRLLLDPTGGPGDSQHQATDMRQLVEQLSARLKANPGDLEGWVLLGRSLVSMEDYEHAATAYATARRIAGDSPELLMESAQALAMGQQGELAGAPMELVQRVLALEPQNHEALWFSGVDAFQRGEFAGAIEFWNRVLPQLEDAESAQTVRDSIARAQSMLSSAGAGAGAGEAAAGGQPAAKIVLQVSLAPELAAAAAPGDTVFVFARAAQGAAMPIAAKRLTVAQLPATVVLDDSDGMVDQRLSTFDKVVVVARVAKSGGVGGKAGDLEGNITVDIGGEAALIIDRAIQ